MSAQIHKVSDGECINSIAFKYGFLPDTLWSHADNSGLRDKRSSPNVLEAGDEVSIPELTTAKESGGTESKHRFRRKGVPAMLRIKFQQRKAPEEEEQPPSPIKGPSEYEEPELEEKPAEYEPLADAPYVISGDVEDEGTSDGEGMVEIPISPDALQATIVFHKDTPEQVIFELALGTIDPVDTPKGLAHRLSNLNYACLPDSKEEEIIRAALKQFQIDHELDATGEDDQATRDKLMEAHGS